MRHLAWLALLLPPRALAADVTTIVPSGKGIMDVVSVTSEGTGFAAYLTTAHAVGVAVVAAIAVVMIVWGAVGIFGENVWGKTKGKERVQNAILGLLLAAGSYVILKTISASLTSADFSLDGNLGTEVSGTAITNAAGSTGTTGSTSGTTGSTGGTSGTSGTTGEAGSNRPWTGSGDYSVPSELSASEYDAYVRTLFSGNGISVNKGYADGSSTNTNLDGLQEVAIQGLITMKGESGATSLTITGGTEPGHAGGTYSHGSGYKIDIRPGDSSFDSYITSTFTNTGSNSLGATYSRDYGSYTVNVIREDDHWDLQFNPD